MTGERVLVVEDDPNLARALSINLRARGYTVDLASGGRSALALVAERHPDVILLDLGLPDMDGVEVIEGVRGWAKTPIIVLSARQTSHDKVRALDVGADDYVTKPFAMDELLARLRAALRRTGDETSAVSSLQTPDFSVDFAARQVTRDGDVVRLTPKEWGILQTLTRNAGRLVSQDQLLREVWGPGYEGESHYLRVYMAQLRRKLEPDHSRPRYFITEPGMGYRFVEPDDVET
jgi:two-component system, OmpR family, KDP operon response regulator KdpE